MKRIIVIGMLILLAIGVKAQITIEDSTGCQQDTMIGKLMFHSANLPNEKIESVQIIYVQGGCIISYTQDSIVDDTCIMHFSAKKWSDNIKIYFKINGTYRCHIYANIILDCGVLPVELLYYEADSCLLKWATITEVNSWYYQIIKDNEVVGTVEAAGYSYQINEYQFEVKEEGYYYLNQIDLDGTINQLGVIYVDYESIVIESIYYNMQGQRINQLVSPCIKCINGDCKIIVIIN
jgi:hypothetical protein